MSSRSRTTDPLQEPRCESASSRTCTLTETIWPNTSDVSAQLASELRLAWSATAISAQQAWRVDVSAPSPETLRGHRSFFGLCGGPEKTASAEGRRSEPTARRAPGPEHRSVELQLTDPALIHRIDEEST